MSPQNVGGESSRPGTGGRLMSLIARRSVPTAGLIRIAAFGAIGCAAGALIAELFYLVAPTGSGQGRAIVQVIDVSGSMSDKIDVVKAAARRFVHDTMQSVRDEGTSARIGVVKFSDSATVESSLTDKEADLDRVIENLRIEGGTTIGRGLEAAETVFQRASADDRRTILIFSDGQSSDQTGAETVARRLREAGTKLVAISTDDASTRDLANLTGDPSLVVPTSVAKIDDAFEDARKKVMAGQFASNASYTWAIALALSAALGGLMGLGLAAALAVAQILSTKGNLGAQSQTIVASAMVGLVAGLVAAIAGQLLYLVAQQVPILGLLGSWTGWCLMGGLLGLGTSRAIPNLDRVPGTLGGALGGLVGGLGFLLIAKLLSDMPGRLVGAAVLGFAVGMMIVLVERLTREAWLVLRWGNETGTIGLGATPIRLGSSRDSHVRLDPGLGYPPHYATIELRDGRVELKEAASGKVHKLANGNKLPLGKLEVEVRTV